MIGSLKRKSVAKICRELPEIPPHDVPGYSPIVKNMAIVWTICKLNLEISQFVPKPKVGISDDKRLRQTALP